MSFPWSFICLADKESNKRGRKRTKATGIWKSFWSSVGGNVKDMPSVMKLKFIVMIVEK
jgi:hypothetical protein